MNILGISAFYHDSAAALVQKGDIVAAAQEERFTRIRHNSAFPAQAVKYCLEAGRVTLKDIDHVVFYDKPFLKFERLLETYLALAPRGFRSFAAAFPVWSREKLFQREMLSDELARHMPEVNIDKKLMFTEHHQSHAASAFYPSPFEDRGDPDDGWRRRMDDDLGGAGRGQLDRDPRARSISRIRSACSTRRSPTTSGSRSIPASTR